MAGISAETIVTRLSRGEAVPAAVLLGTDPYLRDICRQKIVDACVPEAARDWALTRIPVRDTGWDEVLQRAQTMPMLSPRQVIIVQGAESLEEMGEDHREEILEALGKYLDSPAPFTVLLLEATALDRRQRFYKLLAEKAFLIELTIGSESAASITSQMAKDCRGEIDPQAASLLAEILNNEPARIRMEIEKLVTYAADRCITCADVDALVVAARKNTVWQLTDMIATRRRDAALEFLDHLLRDGEQPVALVGALAWMYRKLIEARDLPPGMNGFQAAKQLGMRADAAEAAVRQAHRIPKRDLLSGLIALAEADSQLKSSNPDPRAMMEFLMVRLMSSGASSSTQVSWAS